MYDDLGAAAQFVATETFETRVYQADVAFAAEGNWTITVHSGFVDSRVKSARLAQEVLVWTEAGRTVRLEGDFSRESALRVAVELSVRSPG